MKHAKVIVLLVVIALTGTFIAFQLNSGEGRPRGAATGITTSAAGAGGGSSDGAAGASTGATEDNYNTGLGNAAAAATMVPASNPQIAAAQEKARARWSEFAEAWNARAENQSFYIKKCFEDAGKTECLWCVVEKIDAGTIIGRLDNDPLILRKTLSRGDEVTCAVEQINDWMVTDGVTIKGGFTEHTASVSRP